MQLRKQPSHPAYVRSSVTIIISRRAGGNRFERTIGEVVVEDRPETIVPVAPIVVSVARGLEEIAEATVL